MAYGDKMETSSDYIKWNNRLAKFFFNEEMAGREVLLYVNRQIIHSIGEGLGDVEHFINSVKIGPPWVTRSGLCQKALQAYEGWRNAYFGEIGHLFGLKTAGCPGKSATPIL